MWQLDDRLETLEEGLCVCEIRTKETQQKLTDATEVIATLKITLKKSVHRLDELERRCSFQSKCLRKLISEKEKHHGENTPK